MVIINDDIASENFKKGVLVLVESRKLDKLQLGEEIFVYRVNEGGSVSVELGRVGQIYLEENAVAFENGDIFSNQFVIGTAGEIYNDIGTYLAIMNLNGDFCLLY